MTGQAEQTAYSQGRGAYVAIYWIREQPLLSSAACRIRADETEKVESDSGLAKGHGGESERAGNRARERHANISSVSETPSHVTHLRVFAKASLCLSPCSAKRPQHQVTYKPGKECAFTDI